MWKKQEDAFSGTPSDFDSRNEFGPKEVTESSFKTNGEGRMGPQHINQADKAKMAVGPQKVPTEARYQPSMPASIAAYPANMAAYAEAVNEFTRNATAFIEQLPLLTSARAAYDRAMKASAELRKVLDIGDEDLRLLMTQLQQVFDGQVIRQPSSDRKKPEAAKTEAARTDEGSETIAGIKRLP